MAKPETLLRTKAVAERRGMKTNSPKTRGES